MGRAVSSQLGCVSAGERPDSVLLVLGRCGTCIQSYSVSVACPLHPVAASLPCVCLSWYLCLCFSLSVLDICTNSHGQLGAGPPCATTLVVMLIKLGWDPGEDSGHKGMSVSGVLVFSSTQGTWAVTIPLSSGLEMPEHGGGAPESGRTRGDGGCCRMGSRLEP